MKKIHLLLIKAFIRPFIVTFFVVMFILLMFFLFKYVDDLIGKGFEWYTIAEVMMYASAANVAMALPLSILLSSIMTFGTLGENYELVAIKSAGVSLRKAMQPLLVFVIGLSIASFLFSDYMLPKANLKYGSLLYDMRNKKLSFLIKPGVFNNSITNYAMRIERKGEGTVDSLFGITIYDHSAGNGIAKIIMAEKGQMSKTKDGQYLVLKLINGIRYEESNGSTSSFNARQVLTRMRFRETEVKFDFSSFKGMDRTQESQFANNAQMLNRAELINRRDSLTRSIDTMDKATKMNVVGYYKQSSFTRGYTKINLPAKELIGPLINSIPLKDQAQAVQSASDQAETVKQVIGNRIIEHDMKTREVIKAKIEYQRKYTLAISCLLLFFIGAPLGAIIRKGGLGLPVVIAVVFFLIYHIISTVSEKSAKEGTLDPILGMWMAIIILTPLGIFLTYKATVDSALFDLDYYKQLVTGLFKKLKSKSTNAI